MYGILVDLIASKKIENYTLADILKKTPLEDMSICPINVMILTFLILMTIIYFKKYLCSIIVFFLRGHMYLSIYKGKATVCKVFKAILKETS